MSVYGFVHVTAHAHKVDVGSPPPPHPPTLLSHPSTPQPWELPALETHPM